MSDHPETPAQADIFKKKTRILRKVVIWDHLKPRRDPIHNPEFNQAEKVIARLGGPHKAAKLLGVAPSTIYRWMDARWSNGIIPTQPAAKIRRIARQEGILLTKDDWMPEAYPTVTDEDPVK